MDTTSPSTDSSHNIRTRRSVWTEGLEKHYRSTSPRQALLADDLLKMLGDIPENLPIYRFYARRFDEAYLRETASFVKDLPEHRVTKSRGAIFGAILKRGKRRRASS